MQTIGKHRMWIALALALGIACTSIYGLHLATDLTGLALLLAVLGRPLEGLLANKDAKEDPAKPKAKKNGSGGLFSHKPKPAEPAK